MIKKLYLVERIGHVGWDDTAGQVICAYNIKNAKILIDDDDLKKQCTIIKIGTAMKHIKEGVVITDFRAG